MSQRFKNPTLPLDTLRQLIRPILLLLLTLSLSADKLAAQNGGEITALKLRQPIERELAGGQAHSYTIALIAGQFLRVVVEQRGVDVVLTLYGPDGRKLSEVDSPNGTQGPETVLLVAEVSGSYRLEVRSPDESAQAGRYEARLEELRPATEQDKQRVAAQRAVMHATQLRAQRSASSAREAIKEYEQALAIFRAQGARDEEAAMLFNIGDVYYNVDENLKALDYLKQSLSIRHTLADRYNEASTLKAIGQVYDELGDKRKQLDYYKQSLALIQSLGDTRDEIEMLFDVSKVYEYLGDSQQALNHLNKALALDPPEDKDGVGSILQRIGSTYEDLGDEAQALNYYNQALKLFQASGNTYGQSIVFNRMADIYDASGDKRKALELHTAALSIKKSLDATAEQAVTLTNISKLRNDLGQRQQALADLDEAIRLSRSVEASLDKVAVFTQIANACDALGEKQKAREFFEQVLLIARSRQDKFSEAGAHLGLARTYPDGSEQALDHLNQSVLLWRAAGFKSAEADTLVSIARAERVRGSLTSAVERTEAALVILESLRANITNQELRSSYFATVHSYYEFYIELLMRLHAQQPSAGYDGKALQACERGRARSLLETLAEANADIRQGVDSKLLERERALQQQLNAKAQAQLRLLSRSHAETEANAIAGEVEALTNEFRQVETQIRQTSPRYAALTQPVPLTPKEIQTQVLDADTVLLEFSLGTERSYLWAMTPNTITSYELPKREEIETAARQFYELLTTPPSQATDAAPGKSESGGGLQLRTGKRLAQASAQLSRMLLERVAPLLGNKRLLVVADGALQYIPFAALPIPTGDAGTTTAAPLIVEHEIVNLPSASALAVLRRESGTRSPTTKTLAILADPVFGRDDERLKARTGKTEARGRVEAVRVDETHARGLVVTTAAKQSGVADADLSIPRLPGTRREADEIVKLVPPTQSKEALDFAASRATATSTELGQYRYVHFATHGLINSQHPELSGVVLSLFDERGEPQDGFLRAHEVFNLKLAADVVVLSACQTGLGKEVKGEGLISLTRGFMYAGSPRVVVSLWSVNDAATAELMVRFYRGMLKENLRPAAALRAAQISLMKEGRWESPFHWAAFTLQGEWR